MVSYYLSKVIDIVEQKINELNNIPIEVKNRVHTIDKHPNSSVLSCKREIPT